MTPKAKESLKYTLATLAIEKVTPSRRTVRLCEKITEGRISRRQRRGADYTLLWHRNQTPQMI